MSGGAMDTSDAGESVPCGTVAILIGPDGREISTATDFSQSNPSGFTVREAQRARVRSALALRTVRDLASSWLAEAIPRHQAEQIMAEMCRNGCRVVMVDVGRENP